MAKKSTKVNIEVVKSASGVSVYLNNYRIAGKKPVPYAETILFESIEIQDIHDALGRFIVVG